MFPFQPNPSGSLFGNATSQPSTNNPLQLTTNPQSQPLISSFQTPSAAQQPASGGSGSIPFQQAGGSFFQTPSTTAAQPNSAPFQSGGIKPAFQFQSTNPFQPATPLNQPFATPFQTPGIAQQSTAPLQMPSITSPFQTPATSAPAAQPFGAGTIPSSYVSPFQTAPTSNPTPPLSFSSAASGTNPLAAFGSSFAPIPSPAQPDPSQPFKTPSQTAAVQPFGSALSSNATQFPTAQPATSTSLQTLPLFPLTSIQPQTAQPVIGQPNTPLFSSTMSNAPSSQASANPPSLFSLQPTASPSTQAATTQFQTQPFGSLQSQPPAASVASSQPFSFLLQPTSSAQPVAASKDASSVQPVSTDLTTVKQMPTQGLFSIPTQFSSLIQPVSTAPASAGLILGAEAATPSQIRSKSLCDIASHLSNELNRQVRSFEQQAAAISKNDSLLLKNEEEIVLLCGINGAALAISQDISDQLEFIQTRQLELERIFTELEAQVGTHLTAAKAPIDTLDESRASLYDSAERVEVLLSSAEERLADLPDGAAYNGNSFTEMLHSVLNMQHSSISSISSSLREMDSSLLRLQSKVSSLELDTQKLLSAGSK